MVNLSVGKNSTDIALAVDAMDLVIAERPDVVAIVSSDSDFTPLVGRLREKGAWVRGFGQQGKTGEGVQAAYDQYDDLAHGQAKKAVAAKRPKAQAKPQLPKPQPQPQPQPKAQPKPQPSPAPLPTAVAPAAVRRSRSRPRTSPRANGRRAGSSPKPCPSSRRRCRPEVEAILQAVPRLRGGERVELGEAAQALRQASMLGKTEASTPGCSGSMPSTSCFRPSGSRTRCSSGPMPAPDDTAGRMTVMRRRTIALSTDVEVAHAAQVARFADTPLAARRRCPVVWWRCHRGAAPIPAGGGIRRGLGAGHHAARRGVGAPPGASTRLALATAADRTLLKTQDSQASVGSGFLVSKDGRIITNYHVVSQFALNRSATACATATTDGQDGQLELLDFDVRRDLALLRAVPAEAKSLEGRGELDFRPKADPLSKGDRIYSMGNPHDVAFAVVEGTYNGLVERSFDGLIYYFRQHQLRHERRAGGR